MSFADSVVLITGGTGSLGQILTRELLKTNVREVRVFSRDEEKQLEMARAVQDLRVTYFLGDVRDYERVSEVMDGADIVFHAAALKVIPSCEANPLESVKTNINGSINVRRACVARKVKRAVLVSTDKAVSPVNLYGMCKAVAEKIWLQNYDEVFNVVRYGNVVGSRGSVVPFYSQLKKEGKPFPVTDVKMTRFLITLKEAIDLVLYAAKTKLSCRIFVPNIPACNILTLVEAIGGNRYPYEVVGIREGEKLHECLVNEFEWRKTTIGERKNIIVINKTVISKPALNEPFTSNKAEQLLTREVREILRKEGWM